MHELPLTERPLTERRRVPVVPSRTLPYRSWRFRFRFDYSTSAWVAYSWKPHIVWIPGREAPCASTLEAHRFQPRSGLSGLMSVEKDPWSDSTSALHLCR
jgi:hypothetical protein